MWGSVGELPVLLFYLMYMGVLPACMYVHLVHAVLWRPGKGIGSPGIGIRLESHVRFRNQTQDLQKYISTVSPASQSIFKSSGNI